MAKGNKHWANTWTEVEDLGDGKFGANISVGHRVFFDKTDGNKPKKHKLTDNRPDHVLIQGAKCCTEIHPYYAKYFDVQHEEVRLYEERWVVQWLFKEPDEWRDVDTYNPVITMGEYPELAGDVVKVTVTYDTDYGTLIIEYFQRDSNALKHNVTFTNTSSSPETFRVLQRWAGIVADKVNGEEVATPVEELGYSFRFEKAGKLQLGENLTSFIPNWQDEAEATRKMWIRHGECNGCGKCCLGCSHYTEEYPHCKIYEARPELCREWPWSPEQIKDIPECTYSFEATGVIAYPKNLCQTKIDLHPQGLKADFIYGDWTLAQNEGLEIDPDTATLDDPTVDGFIQQSDATYSRYTATTTLPIGKWQGATPPTYTDRSYVEWDISSLSGATITKTEFRYNGQTHHASASNIDIRAMASQPSIQVDDNTGNQVIWDDAGDGTAYLSNDAVFPEVGVTKDVGGASGPAWDTDPTSDVQSALVNGWFAIGIKTQESESPGSKTDWRHHIYSEDKTDAANPKPTLYVEYTTATHYERSAIVNIGVDVSKVRLLGITRASSVLIGNLVTASKVWGIVKSASVNIGNLVSASRAIAITRNSNVLIGNLVSALRLLGVIRLSSVLIGNLVSAFKSWNRTETSSVLIGNLVSAIRLLGIIRQSSVLIGNLVTASRIIGAIRLSSVLIGVLVTATKIWGIVKSSLVLIGNKVSAIRLWGGIRQSSVLIGNKVSAIRLLAIIRNSSVLIGNKVTASGLVAYIRLSSVLIGNLVTASRAIGIIRDSSVLIGVKVLAIRLLGIIRESLVSIGVLVTASRIWSHFERAIVKIGVKVTVFYCVWLKELIRVPISRLKATRMAVSRIPLFRRLRSCK